MTMEMNSMRWQQKATSIPIAAMRTRGTASMSLWVKSLWVMATRMRFFSLDAAMSQEAMGDGDEDPFAAL